MVSMTCYQMDLNYGLELATALYETLKAVLSH
jgi:hypothetical protein